MSHICALLLGFDYNLPDMVAKNIGFPPYPECPFLWSSTRW